VYGVRFSEPNEVHLTGFCYEYIVAQTAVTEMTMKKSELLIIVKIKLYIHFFIIKVLAQQH
jgi:hypothetical protein